MNQDPASIFAFAFALAPAAVPASMPAFLREAALSIAAPTESQCPKSISTCQA